VSARVIRAKLHVKSNEQEVRVKYARSHLFTICFYAESFIHHLFLSFIHHLFLSFIHHLFLSFIHHLFLRSNTLYAMREKYVTYMTGDRRQVIRTNI